MVCVGVFQADDYEDDFCKEEEEEEEGGAGWRVIDVAEVEVDSSKPLGGGGFALVYRGMWRGQAVAVKTLVRLCNEGNACARAV